MTNRKEDEDLDWQRAHELADSFPRWSDEEWREVNATLGYRVVSASGRKDHKPIEHNDSSMGEAA